MQQDILPSIKKVIKTAQHVSVKKDAIERFCDSFSPTHIITAELGNSDVLDISRSIGLVCVFNCVNFCFWTSQGGEKWAVNIGGKPLDGAMGMFCALEAALERGVPLLDAHYLAELNREEFHELLDGNREIPLLDERVQNLQEAGKVLIESHDGSFMNVYNAAHNNAVELTNIFIKSFPSFDDYAVLNGQRIEFHKRAQLNADMINYRLAKKGEKELQNLDKLTAFADYKVPQMLRKLGILEYAAGLAHKVDSYIEIEAGSREEIEIRAATVWAIEEMKNALTPRYPKVTARQLDDHLWTLGQAKSSDGKPYHRTRTIA